MTLVRAWCRDPGDCDRALWPCLHIVKIRDDELRCCIISVRNPSPKNTINKAIIPLRLLKRMILVFQVIADKELLNPWSMEQ
jgi:hypothetical protein